MNLKCPSHDVLRRYIIGDYDDSEGETIEQHLESCTVCEETLATFDESGDTLVRHLPLAVQDSNSGDPAWLHRLRKAPPVEKIDADGNAETTDSGVISGLESYELLGVLGRGGMGVVYRARHRQLDRSVAIKVMHPKLTSASLARDRFEREIRILGALRHPGIVMATDAGKVGDAAYLVMEYVDGIDLARLVRNAGPLSVSDACWITIQIASALDAAHAAGAIHRDVKPSNVMLERGGRTKLLDFGLAQFSPTKSVTEETSVGWMLGTLDYMSPEQSEGKKTTSRSDVYSLGATLFYLLAARPPHRNGDEASVLDQLRSLADQAAPRLDSLRGDVPVELADFVQKLLATNPESRPDSVGSVGQFLGQFVSQSREISGELSETVATEASSLADQKADPDAVVASLHELLGHSHANSLLSMVSNSETGAPRGSTSRVGWLVGLGTCAVAAVLAGIMFLIQTRSGTLRIESDVADVRIELVDEDQSIKQLEITGGAQETRLRAGRYRIRLASGYDRLQLAPDTIVVSSGEDQVAKITRVVANRDEPAETPRPTKVAASADPNLKKGVTFSVKGKTKDQWVELFHSSADPVAKLSAARNAIMVARMAKDEDVILPIRLGGELIRDGWGEGYAFCVLDQLKTNEDRLSVEFNPKNWTADDQTWKDWQKFIRDVDEFFGKQSVSEVDAYLGHALSDGADHEAAFVMVLLADPDCNLLSRSDLQKRVVASIRPESSRSSLLTLVLASRYPTLGRESIHAAYLLLADDLDRPISSELDRKMTRAWLRYGDRVFDDCQNAAPLLLRAIVDDPAIAEQYFRFDWMRDSRPYFAQYQLQRFEGSSWFLAYWPDAINSYWIDGTFDEVTEADRMLFKTLHFYAMTETQMFDQGVANRTIKILSRWLDNYYGSVDADAIDQTWETLLPGRPDELLATIINLGGELPDSVYEGLPRSRAARESLAKFKSLIESSPTRQEMMRQGTGLAGTIQLAAFQCVKVVLNSKSLPPGMDHQRTLMLATNGTAEVNEPVMDPLLLLTLCYEVICDSEGDPARPGFENLFFGGSTKLLYQHCKDALEASSRQGQIAIARLAEIAMRCETPLFNQISGFDKQVQGAMASMKNPGGGGFF